MAKFVPVDIFDLVIFGGAGDLALRKLMPALYHRDMDGQLPVGCRIISVGRSAISHDEFLGMVGDSLRKKLADSEFSSEFWQSFSQRLQYSQADALDPSGWQDLKQVLEGFEDRIRVFYLATAPKLFGAIASGLSQNGLITSEVRIVLEKPVGNDYASALEINDRVGGVSGSCRALGELIITEGRPFDAVCGRFYRYVLESGVNARVGLAVVVPDEHLL